MNEHRTTDSMTPRTRNMTLETTSSRGRAQRMAIEEYRRRQADRAIARIEECYRRGLAIRTFADHDRRLIDLAPI